MSRTYNFPQERVTDHRIGLTLHRLNEILDGTRHTGQVLLDGQDIYLPEIDVVEVILVIVSPRLATNVTQNEPPCSPVLAPPTALIPLWAQNQHKTLGTKPLVRKH